VVTDEGIVRWVFAALFSQAWTENESFKSFIVGLTGPLPFPRFFFSLAVVILFDVISRHSSGFAKGLL